MSNTDLTDITGVGDGKADSLRDAGFETAKGVFKATVEEISEADGFGEGNAAKIIGNAYDAIPEDEIVDLDFDEDAEPEDTGGSSAGMDDTAEAEAEADELFEGGSEDVPWSEEDLTELVGIDASVGPDTYGLELETDAQILVHVIHVVLEEATAQHQSTNITLRDTAYGLARKLMTALMDSGELVDTKLILTSEELSAFYRALTAGSSDYAGRAGIPAMWGEFETIRAQVNEKREEAMAD